MKIDEEIALMELQVAAHEVLFNELNAKLKLPGILGTTAEQSIWVCLEALGQEIKASRHTMLEVMQEERP